MEGLPVGRGEWYECVSWVIAEKCLCNQDSSRISTQWDVTLVYLGPRAGICDGEGELDEYANVCSHRYRIELVPAEDSQGCGAPVEDAGGGSRSDAAGGERFRVGAGVAGGDGADAAGLEAVSAGGAGAWGGPGKDGGDVGDAGCAQRGGVSGVGEGGDGLESGDHFRVGRRAADSPGRDRRRSRAQAGKCC